MMKTLAMMLSMVWAVNSMAALTCDFDRKSFKVEFEGVEYVYDTFDGFNSDCVATDTVAALYDGDDLIVFNSLTKKFDFWFAQDLYEDYDIAAFGGTVGLYDGKNFVIYDIDRERFDSQRVRRDYKNAVVEVGGGVATLYDGDRFHVYRDRKFYDQEVENGFLNFMTAPGYAVALAYDGDNVISFCGGEFDSARARNSRMAQSFGQPGDRRVGLIVDDFKYTIDSSTCELRREKRQ